MGNDTGKMRATQHSGRKGHASHNDRFYYELHPEEGRHINKELSKYNREWAWNDRTGKVRFYDSEMEYYETHFSDALNAQNEKYERKRNYDRVQDMGDWYESRQKRPEEILIQIGDVKNHVDPKTLGKICNEYQQELQKWNKEHGEPFQILNGALHVDEATPHLHLRRVWKYKDENGMEHIGQDKALEQAGVSLPEPGKPRSRYNNRKQTFDKMMREKLLDIAEKYGVDIERVPIPNQRSKELDEYIRDREEEHLEAEQKLEQEKKKFAKERTEKISALNKREAFLNGREQSLNAREGRVSAKEAQLSDLEKDMVEDATNVKIISFNARRLLEKIENMADLDKRCQRGLLREYGNEADETIKKWTAFDEMMAEADTVMENDRHRQREAGVQGVTR